MWKKIDNPETYSEIILGSYISDDPNNPEDFYEVRALRDNLVIAIHANGKVKLKVFDEKELVEKWWLKC